MVDKKPVSLDCGHSICIECVNRMKALRRVECPLDRQVFDNYSEPHRINYGLMAVAANAAETTQGHSINLAQKHIIWVDDNPLNNKRLVDHCKTNDILLKSFVSTDAVLTYLIANQNLLNRDTRTLRIVTDLARDENNNRDYEAGLKLAEKMRASPFAYAQPIFIYTGPSSWLKMKERSDLAKYGNLIFSASEKQCERFVFFEDDPIYLYSPTNKTCFV
jgi:hypothetical protein